MGTGPTGCLLSAVGCVEALLPPAFPTAPPPPHPQQLALLLNNSSIYFTVLYVGRGFQNTLGLFTELCKNILSPSTQPSRRTRNVPVPWRGQLCAVPGAAPFL